MKNIVLFILYCCSLSCFAMMCDKAVETSDPKFCTDFQRIAQCHCEDYFLQQPDKKKQCVDMDFIYKTMIATFGSQGAACHWQEFFGLPVTASYQECMKDWNYYRSSC